MSEPNTRVVYDCNVLVQALLNGAGPAGACVDLAIRRKVDLILTEYILDELRAMPSRPTPRKLGLTDERVDDAIRSLAGCSRISDVPPTIVHPVDEKDSHYVNLAIVAGAKLIVLRDNHLLNLTNPVKPWSLDFRTRFPWFRVLKPDEFLAERARDFD